MNYFQVADKINQLHLLTFAERALLNQITSYHFNEKTFFASNEYLANYWGVTERSITRYVTKLKHLGFVIVHEDNKLNDFGKWDNRRFIYPIIENILNEGTELEKYDTIPAPEPPALVEKYITIETTEPIVFNYPENEDGDEIPDEAVGIYFTTVEETAKIEEPEPVVSPFANEYDIKRVIKLIPMDDTLLMTVKKRIPSFAEDIIITKEVEECMQGVFKYGIKNNERMFEKYRAVC